MPLVVAAETGDADVVVLEGLASLMIFWLIINWPTPDEPKNIKINVF